MQQVSTSARRSALAVAVITLLAAGSAAAAGFQVRESSTKAGGRAYAGTTVASNDTAVVSGNPAAMVNNTGVVAQVGVGVISLDSEFTGSGNTLLGTTLTGNNGGNPGSPKPVPSLGVIVPMQGSLEGLTLGASITAPLGSGTEYEAGWLGRYNATTTDVKTADLTLSAAVQISPAFSAGIGLIFERAEVGLGKDLPLGVMLAAGLQNPALASMADGSILVEGASNNIGWVAGMQFAPNERFALGYSHRSEIKHDFKGHADFTTPAAFQAMQPGFAAAAAAPGLTAAQRQQLLVLGNGFVDTAVRARLVTPAIDTLSVKVGVSDRVTLYGEAQRTGWSSLQNVNIAFESPYQPASREDFHWKDTMFYSLGADFALSERFTLRGGVGLDESPTNDTDRTPRLPDNDRRLYSLGLGWNVNDKLSLDASLTYVDIKDSSSNLPINPVAPHSRYTSLKGQYSGHATVAGLGMTYKF